MPKSLTAALDLALNQTKPGDDVPAPGLTDPNALARDDDGAVIQAELTTNEDILVEP